MHEQFLQISLAEAMHGRGSCSPNPSVGAVAVYDNEIIAQAYHQGAGQPHAEQLVLAKIGQHRKNVTLYVTLEPCNHWGRTPPCVDAIIAHGISHVVYAFKDPNPIVANRNTEALLTAHGIKVTYCPMPEIDEFYRSYAYWVRTGKPWVSAKIAQTFDGKIAGPGGEKVALTNAKLNEFTHVKRLQSDIILTTTRTINADDPQLNVRLPNNLRAKPLAIIDTNLSVNPDAQALKLAQSCLFYFDSNLKVTEKIKNCDYFGVKSSAGLLDLHAVISHLGSLGYHDVWVEAGGGLFSALHVNKLVNTTYIYLVPKTLGEFGVSAYQHKDVLGYGALSVNWRALDDNMLVKLEW